MFKFKTPDYRDDSATYMKDNAGRDFWTTRNWFGKIICSPLLLTSLMFALLMKITRK